MLNESEEKNSVIATVANVSIDTVKRWQLRQENGLNIWDTTRQGRPRLYGKDLEDRFIAFYCQSTPLSKHGRWSLRWAQAELDRISNSPQLKQTSTSPLPRDVVGVSLKRSTMQRMLSRHKLRPHRNGYFMHISDPDFFPKMMHLVALYGAAPKHLYCFDECPGIQILQRITPDMRPNEEAGILRWWKEFEYIRNGTTDLFAFLNVGDGKLDLSCHPDHTKSTFIARFKAHLTGLQLPNDERIDYIMDNLASHCSYEFCALVAELSNTTCPAPSILNNSDKRRQWLQRDDKRIIIHFTPFHGSWLNLVEICFSGIYAHCLHEQYASPEQFHCVIMEYQNYWNDFLAHPFNWQYDGSGLHQKVVQRFIILLTSPDSMTLQFLTKSCKLMLNLLRDYPHEIENQCWVQLADVVIAQKNQLQATIDASEQPIVKVNAANALTALVQATTAFATAKIAA